MYLVKHDNQLRSVSMRYEESIKKQQLDLLYELINTIEIFKPTLSLP